MLGGQVVDLVVRHCCSKTLDCLVQLLDMPLLQLGQRFVASDHHVPHIEGVALLQLQQCVLQTGGATAMVSLAGSFIAPTSRHAALGWSNAASRQAALGWSNIQTLQH